MNTCTITAHTRSGQAYELRGVNPSTVGVRVQAVIDDPDGATWIERDDAYAHADVTRIEIDLT